jgi:internalin A
LSASEGALLTARQLQHARQTGTLELNNMGLTAPPPGLGQLTNLWSLSLTHNRLTRLSPGIAQLTHLSKLNLSNNWLVVLPPEIVRLSSLETLDLIGNRLTELSPEIGQLTELESLLLNVNRLTAVPPEIGQLTSLERLDLSGNQLTALPPEIGQLAKLRTLNLSRNQLTALPPEIGQLTKLRSLNLDDNRLTALPPDIGHLTRLESLNLERNRLSMLPPELAALLEKTLIDLDGNPLREPLPELIGRGPSALAAYLRSLPDGILQYDAKVLLLGEGNVGKTSLVAALRSAPFLVGRPTTHGIEIRSLTMPHPNLDADITVRTWDFGGQDLYRITHQFFFSRRSLYLVVWHPREGQEQNDVEGWLRRIRLRIGSEARALVVATHCDEFRPELDFPHLKQMFPELLVGQCEVDNRSRNGIVELRKKIAAEAARLPQMGQLINPRWIAARDEILARAETHPQIPYEEFVRICRGHQVNSEETVTLAELMHDLGHIIYYGDDEGLRDLVVLNPEWLTKAISYVIQDVSTRQSAGVLDHARLVDIWQNRQDGYPARYHPYFLRLMENSTSPIGWKMTSIGAWSPNSCLTNGPICHGTWIHYHLLESVGSP